MKKIFTLLTAAAATLAMQAAAPELLFKGQPVAPGTTNETGYTLEVLSEEIPGWGTFTSYSYTQDADLEVRGDAAKSVTVTVKATAKVQYCGLDDSCVNTTDGSKTVSFANCHGAVVSGNTATAPLDIHIVTDDYDGVPASTLLKDVTVEVTAFYTDSPSETVSTTVMLTSRPDSEVGGVINVVSNPTMVKYANGILNYNIASAAKLSIYSIAGNLVMCQRVCGNGSVALDSLHSGVYIYTLGDKSGKLIVNKAR